MSREEAAALGEGLISCLMSLTVFSDLNVRMHYKMSKIYKMLSVQHFEMQDGQIITSQQNGFYKLSTAISSRKELICEICKFQHTMTKSQKYIRTFTFFFFLHLLISDSGSLF